MRAAPRPSEPVLDLAGLVRQPLEHLVGPTHLGRACDHVLGLMDQVAGNVFLVLGGLLLAVFVGWVMKDPIALVSQGSEGVRWFGVWRFLLRFVVPVLLAFVLVGSVQGAIDAIREMTG